MMLLVVLYFLGYFVTSTAGSTIVFDCNMSDQDYCGTIIKPCHAKFNESFSEFYKDEIVVMTYQQDANASDPSCSDSGCEQYTSHKTYYTVDDFSVDTEDTVIMGRLGRDAFCEEVCAVESEQRFSGYCQTEGQCTNTTTHCLPFSSPAGSATFVKFGKDIVIDCDMDDEENCGTGETPCNAKFHTSSGLSQYDVVSMMYDQFEAPDEASCVENPCLAYQSLTYYIVVDTTAADEGEVIIGAKGFTSACPYPCAETEGDPFSGYCQREHKCTAISGECAGSSNPQGKAYFQWEWTSPPTATTTATTTTTATGTTAAATGTTTTATGTTTAATGTTTAPSTASAMTTSLSLAPAAFAVVAVLALWA